jgi:hypothetical protein
MARKKTPKLVTQYLENISREALGSYRDIVKSVTNKRTGIYALYQGNQLYYAGLASNLRQRLNQHLKDRHQNSWDTFSVYLTIGESHLRELESLILRIIQPYGNRVRGKFSGAENIHKKFEQLIAQIQKNERARIVGITPKHKLQLKNRSIKIQGKHFNKTHKATLLPDYSVRFDRKLYSSPSAAGAAAVKRISCSGWTFWQYERSPGDWIAIDYLRKNK